MFPMPRCLKYLLPPNHPEGGPKAAFFAGAGYTQQNGESLRNELLRIAAQNEVVGESTIECGQKYVVEGTLSGIDGAGIPLRTIWVIDRGTTSPRFVTAYRL